MKAKKNCVYLDATNTTNRILQVLENPKIPLMMQYSESVELIFLAAAAGTITTNFG